MKVCFKITQKASLSNDNLNWMLTIYYKFVTFLFSNHYHMFLRLSCWWGRFTEQPNNKLINTTYPWTCFIAQEAWWPKQSYQFPFVFLSLFSFFSYFSRKQKLLRYNFSFTLIILVWYHMKHVNINCNYKKLTKYWKKWSTNKKNLQYIETK